MTSDSSNQTAKKASRAEFRRRLQAAPDARESAGLCARLVTFLSSRTGLWAAFQPVGLEADVRPALKASSQIDFVYPRVDRDGMAFFKSQAAFVPNKWGILEPDPALSERVSLTDLEGLLIPALAFDLKLNRLGRGGGYYDRTLAEIRKTNPRAEKIGVALERQISTEDLPTEPFDIPMDWVVTEARTLENKRIPA